MRAIRSTLALTLFCSLAATAGELHFDARQRVPSENDSAADRLLVKPLAWEGAETAVIVCDMWDQHWCAGATRRVAEMAPRMNDFLNRARAEGALIVHAPSSTIANYGDHPARKLAQSAPLAKNLPDNMQGWCDGLDSESGIPWPVDQSDGGCDCTPTCEQAQPWRKQIATIDIRDEDVLSDSGLEIANVFALRGIKNVLVLGVHTNMCVIGRPFGLRNMVRLGMNVALVRDLTDTMYNSKSAPFVNHFTGTDLVVAHIERYVCPTVTSDALLGGKPFHFSEDERPRVAFIMGEREYRSEQRLPEFARLLETRYGLAADFIAAAPQPEGDEGNYLRGIATLEDAGLAVLYVRRRALPPEQMQALRAYLASGRPLIALRTASHAFDTKRNAPKELAEWPEFDSEVLGCNYANHYGADGGGGVAAIAPGMASHPILAGAALEGFVSEGSLYRSAPLAPAAQALLTATLAEHPPEPVLWTHRYGDSRIVATSLGHWNDFKNDAFQRMLVNAVFWAMDRPAAPRE